MSDVAIAETAGLLAYDTKGSQLGAVRGGDRAAGVEPDPRVLHHEGIVDEAGVVGGVGNDHGIIAVDGVPAERHVPRCLGCFETLAGLEPLTVLIDEADQRDQRVEETLGHPGDPVEALFGWRVEKTESMERAQATQFVWQRRRFDHRLSIPEFPAPRTGSRYRRGGTPAVSLWWLGSTGAVGSHGPGVEVEADVHRLEFDIKLWSRAVPNRSREFSAHFGHPDHRRGP